MVDRKHADEANRAEAPDEELLAAFLRGEREMFAELVNRYEGPLYGFICRLTGRPHDADDLFQETFVRVFQKGGTFGGDSSFKTWLYAIAANLCRSHGRKLQRQARVLAESDAVPAGGPPSPNEAAEAREIGERIGEAVSRLPHDQREVFILKTYHEMTYPQIAQAVRRPVGTVKSQMRLALAKLREDLRALAQAYDAA